MGGRLSRKPQQYLLVHLVVFSVYRSSRINPFAAEKAAAISMQASENIFIDKDDKTVVKRRRLLNVGIREHFHRQRRQDSREEKATRRRGRRL
jgi:hypothetical protein